MSVWSLVYRGFDPDHEGHREALCTVGNGYFCTRGAAPESEADDVHYPGTYVAGLYNRLESTVSDRVVENEDLVNVPNWLPLTFRAEDGEWFRPAHVRDHEQELDLRRGVLTRRSEVVDDAGHHTQVVQRRLVSMADQHVAALETTIVPLNWSGTVVVRSGIDGGVVNDGVERYRALSQHHLELLDASEEALETVHLVARTNQSKVRLGLAARTRAGGEEPVPETDRALVREDGLVAHDLTFEAAEGRPLTVEKVVTLYTSRDNAISEPSLQSREHVVEQPGFDAILQRHTLAWDLLWRRFAIGMDTAAERTQQILHVHIFHLLQTASEHTLDLDAGVPARGWHGEAYRGHIFWDEIYILPFISLRLPALTRTLLHYRRRRLDAARQNAREQGLSGALYPWQSGSDGREESQKLHLNPRSGTWHPDNSSLQRHINLAVAYNMWTYWEVTGDLEYLRFHAGTVLLEIARFFSDLATYDHARDRYVIRGVMGPDEFHDAYPDTEEPGLDNNAYTNVLVVWLMLRALDLLELLPEPHRQELTEELGLRPEEIERFEDLSRRMFVPFHDGVISQFEGYERLETLDFEAYRREYGDIHRMDRILKAEDDTPNRYQLSKQADVLMLFYLFSFEELRELFGRLGYDFEPETDIARNTEYYLARTVHGSTLSGVVTAWVLAHLDRRRSWNYFCEALESDVSDVQGGTTPEGIHLGAMAGTVDLAQRCYAGLVTRGGRLWFDPVLPDELRELSLNLHYRHHRLDVRITHDRLLVVAAPSLAAPITIGCRDSEPVRLEAGTSRSWSL